MAHAGLSTGFRDGDPDAVRAVYREYGRLVYAVAYRVLGDRGLAEEATQQTFVKAWRAAASFDAERELGPWLVAIARRVAIDVSRRETVRAADPLDSVAPGHPALSSRPKSAEAIYDVWEVRQRRGGAAPRGAGRRRLQHFKGYTHVEIAERLDLPVGTMKSRSFRAHKRLAALLGHLREE